MVSNQGNTLPIPDNPPASNVPAVSFITTLGGDVTLALNAKTGQTLKINTVHPEFTQNRLNSVNDLTINGGGTVVLAPVEGNFNPQPDFNWSNLRSINVQNGTLTVNHTIIQNVNVGGVPDPSSTPLYDPDKSHPLFSPTVNLTLGQNGTLDLTNNYYTDRNPYSNILNLNGSGHIILGAQTVYDPLLYSVTKAGSFTVNGDSSVFSGRITGFDGNQPPNFPSYTLADSNTTFDNDVTRINFNGKFADLNGATIESTSLLSFISPNNKYGTTSTSHNFIRNGASINADELLIGHGHDKIDVTGSTARYSSDHNNATVIASDHNTQINTAQLVVGQQESDKKLTLAADGKTFVPVQNGIIGDKGHSSGTLYVTKGADITISGGSLHGGIYLGNNAGFGFDNRREIASRNNPEIFADGDSDGTIHITGDNVSYDADNKIVQNAGHDGGIVNVDEGTLWIGPVNGSNGSGLITVDHGGQLNLKNSFIVLGGQN
ncbi:hypothetical protein PT283_10200, partial [Acetobacteraceae bacterium ESL0697]|nr:hypothetical protein [Acetobacteraceae bacterium ESL0697]